MVTAARSRLIRFTFIIQNFAQLTEVYGKEKGDTIKGNCGNWIYLISSELSALEEISKMCGDVESKKDDKTASTPLITVSDLQRLPMYTMVILRTREMPFKTKMVPAWKMDKEGMWGKNYPKATYPHREKSAVQLFDIKKVVEEKRQKKIDEMLGSDLPKMPNMPGIPNMPPFNPFENNKKSAPNFDEIVKKIDAKIAELEEEERQEKLKEEQKKQEKKVEKVIEPEKEEPITFKQEEVTDDQFFDDFFADDE